MIQRGHTDWKVVCQKGHFVSNVLTLHRGITTVTLIGLHSIYSLLQRCLQQIENKFSDKMERSIPSRSGSITIQIISWIYWYGPLVSLAWLSTTCFTQPLMYQRELCTSFRRAWVPTTQFVSSENPLNTFYYGDGRGEKTACSSVCHN